MHVTLRESRDTDGHACHTETAHASSAHSDRPRERAVSCRGPEGTAGMHLPSTRGRASTLSSCPELGRECTCQGRAPFTFGTLTGFVYGTATLSRMKGAGCLVYTRLSY